MALRRILRANRFFFIEPASRRVHIAGCTTNPPVAWVTQQARNLSFTGLFERARFLIHDRDSKFAAAFDEVLPLYIQEARLLRDQDRCRLSGGRAHSRRRLGHQACARHARGREAGAGRRLIFLAAGLAYFRRSRSTLPTSPTSSPASS